MSDLVSRVLSAIRVATRAKRPPTVPPWLPQRPWLEQGGYCPTCRRWPPLDPSGRLSPHSTVSPFLASAPWCLGGGSRV